MGTKYGDAPLRDYQIHRIATAEGGYNYFEYIHSKGLRIIMREKEDGSEYLYGLGTWANRASLSYINYNKLA